MRTGTSTLGSLRRLLPLGLCLALAACAEGQNWQAGPAYVTVGGTVTGFTGGTLTLANNGADRDRPPLAISGNGSFKFPIQIANGSGYAVAVTRQPANLTCTVANGIGTAAADVSNVAVNCVPYTFTRRALPAIYTTGKAINYSAYRAAGPALNEIPTDTEIQQDLTLLSAAGYNLLRLFGSEAPQDPVMEKTLKLAAQFHPNMRFQIGIQLAGLLGCDDPKNDTNVAYMVTKLSKYPNVVAISVGNEPSFYSRFMPLACLEGYVRTIRGQVTQPVTVDDDFTFYAGLSVAFGDRVVVRPDTILPLIDFASIHMYPISNESQWNWRQTAAAAGPDRARASMEEALVVAKSYFSIVSNYSYRGANGVTTTIGASMPITIGETGWKARQTNPQSEIEQYEANQVNAKWYADLLYGNAAAGYPSWERSVGGPPTIFWFEAFDEAWKGIDDGWGLWSIQRTPRYVFCGTPGGPACNTNLYQGAGFYLPPPFATITFDSTTINYSLVGFGGAEDSQIATDPTGGTNRVGRVNRSATAEVFAGTIVSTSGGLSAGIIPFTAANTRMSVRVYSPTAGIRVRLKVEDASNPARSVETEATTTRVNAWETLTFDFANQVPGTPALNPAFSYDRVIIFFNFGVPGATAGARTYFFDDITFIGGGGLPLTSPFTDISFNATGVTYTFAGFAGAEDASLVPDPTNASNTVVRVRRSATAELFAGTTISTGPANSVGRLPFTATNTRMSVRVYSPAAGIRVRLKAEDATDPTRSVETEATTTVANAWETLVFNFANPVAGTAALNLAFTYNRLTIFFNFGVTGAAAGAQTFYFDDVLFVPAAPVCGTTAPTCAPATVIPTGAVTIYSETAAVPNFNPFPNWGQNPPVTFSEPLIAGNRSLQYVFGGPGGLYQGLDWAANAVNVSTRAVLHLDFWTANVASVAVSIISAGPLENLVTVPVTPNSWNSIDIPLSSYTVPNKTAIIQIKLEPNAAGTLYVDNVYFN
jgi:exo-beta-1,3-glucanase (GH17 family)